jgi:double zinc ribbon protein
VTVALVLGALLAVGTLAVVLYPIFYGVSPAPTSAPSPRQSEREAAVAALREIEFDRATGKLSDDDYAELKSRYTGEAVLAMRREAVPVEAAGKPPTDDELEAAVLAYRRQSHTCPTCGPRPEADAAFCSNCGRYLHDRCADCGAPVVALDARYCLTCGNRLAA